MVERVCAYFVPQLEREFTRLMPSLKALTEKERRHKERVSEKTQLGASQAFELGERSNYE